MDVYDRLRMYRQARKKFSTRVFLLAALFVILAAAQWVPLLMFDDLQDFFKKHYYISFIVFFCALLTVSVFVFFENIRFLTPLNWLLTFFIVECTIWGFARALIESSIDHFAYSFAAVALAVILFVVIGVFCPHDFTLDVVLLFVGAILLFIAAIFFVMLHIIAQIPQAVYFYLTFVVIMVTMFLMYHSQTIVGGRYAEMRIVDYLLAALIIFHDFVILFVLTFYLASRIDQKKFVEVSTTTTEQPADDE